MSAHAPRQPIHPRPTHRAALTLIETLLAIGVIAVLITVLAVTLAPTRERAGEARSAASLRDHLRAFGAYASDFRDAWAFLGDPASPDMQLRVEDVSIDVTFFDLFAYWHLPMARLGYLADFRGRAFHDLPPYGKLSTSHWYSPTCVSHPDYWQPETRLAGTSQWTVMRHGDVSFPSLKAALIASGLLLREWEQRSADQRVYVFGFADGSAQRVRTQDVLSGYPGGAGLGNGSILDVPLPGMSTLSGLRGRDVLQR